MTAVGHRRHASAVLFATLLWGTTGTVAHQAPAGARQLVVGMGTFGFGGVLLLLLDVRGVRRVFRDRSAWGLLLIGGGGVAGYATLYYVSMALVGVAIGNVVAIGSGPIFVTALELAGSERVPWTSGIATVIAIAGVATLGTSGHSGLHAHPVAGILCAVGAGCGYGSYSWAAGRLISRGVHSRPAMAAIFTTGSCALLPAVFAVGLGPVASAKGAVILGYLAVLPMAGAYLLFGYGLRRMSASVATTLALAEPLVATVLATQVLDEHLTSQAWVGFGMILCGLAVTVLAGADSSLKAPPGTATVDDDSDRRVRRRSL